MRDKMARRKKESEVQIINGAFDPDELEDE